ncbi:MAG: HAD-IA family hydrolase [Deltaproteobacteria bacterium]|nr:HAD-IA family hydrolase [Deltaproteobacteria bacterium]
MNFRAIIFDLFGTIVGDFSAAAASYQRDFSNALGVPYEPLMQHWRQLTDRRTLGEFQTVEESIEHVCGLMGATVTAAQMMKAAETRLNLTRHVLTPRHDAMATFKRLKTDGFKIGLLSNCSIEIPIVWPETELAPLFDSTVFSSRERIKKPAAQIYHLACERLGVKPQDCLYVADGENYELKAAAEVGMYPLLIRTPSAETRGEVLREAREWRGDAIATLSETLRILGIDQSKTS